MSDIKRKAGRPPKTDATCTLAIRAKVDEQYKKFGAKCADNLEKLYDTIYKVATGEEKNAGIKDKVGAAKWCIEEAVKFMEGEKETVDSKSTKTETPEISDSAPLVSLKAVD